MKNEGVYRLDGGTLCNLSNKLRRIKEKRSEKKEIQNGILTGFGAARYRYKFMSEKRHVPFDDAEGYRVYRRDCLLFGKMYGMDIGLHTDSHFCNRNTNVVAVGGAVKHDAAEYYIIPNLAGMNGSAVVFDPLNEISADRLPKHKKVYRLDFNNPESSCRYNPFMIPAGYEGDDKKLEDYAYQLAAIIRETLYSCPVGTYDPYWQNAEAVILSALCLYVMKADMPDSERSFGKLLRITQDIMESDPLTKFESYDLSRDKTYTKTLSKMPDKTYHDIFINMLINMQVFTHPAFRCFEACEHTENLTAEKISGRTACLIVNTAPVADNVKAANFLFANLLYQLYRYGENDIIGKDRTQILPVYTHFYFNHFELLNIPNFLLYIATNRKYGLGFSVITDSIDSLIKKYPNDEHEMIFANSDTWLFFGFPDGRNAVDGTDYKMFAKMCGKKTVPASFRKGCSVSYTPKEYPVLAPQDIYGKVIAKRKILVIVRGTHPMICSRLREDKD